MAHAANLGRGLVRILPPSNDGLQDHTIVHHTQNGHVATTIFLSLFEDPEVKFEGRYTIFYAKEVSWLLLRVHGNGWTERAKKIDAEIRAKAFQPILRLFFHGNIIQLGGDFLIDQSRAFVTEKDGRIRLITPEENARRFQQQLETCTVEENSAEIYKALDALEKTRSAY